jgi:hypothetical protein
MALAMSLQLLQFLHGGQSSRHVWPRLTTSASVSRFSATAPTRQNPSSWPWPSTGGNYFISICTTAPVG